VITLRFNWDAEFNKQLEGLYKVKVGEDAYAVTQMEPVSARHAFPGFDEPRFKTPYDISLTVPVEDVALANTRVVKETPSKDGKWKTLQFATTLPLPTYLIAMAVGPWEVVEAPAIPPNAVRSTPLPLRGIAPRGGGKKLAWALQTAPEQVRFFEEYTQQAYPFDKLDLLGAPDFSAGAMENAGLIIYRDAYLLADADSPADKFRGVYNINAHEIAHQWYGDLVTVPWWDDIWLNEAYATWAQAKASLAMKPEYHTDLSALEGRVWAMKSDSLLSTRKVRQPINGEGDIQTAFDGITYQKGAAVLAMFERWVGEERFRAGMRDYLAKRKFGSGSSDDLIATLSAASGKGEHFAKAMRSFLDQPGVPLVQTTLSCRSGKARLDLHQQRYLPYGVMAGESSTWDVPVCVRFGRGKTMDSQCFLLDKAEASFDVEGSCPDWYLPNADARGYYRFEMDKPDLARLAAAVSSLAPVEQMTYADALSSAFHRGTLPPGTLLEAVPLLAGSELPQVATALLGDLEWIRENLTDAGVRGQLDAWIAQIYMPRLEQLGWRRQKGEAESVTNLRTRLAELLAMTMRWAPARAPLATQGRQALGLGKEKGVDLSRADPDLLDLALKIAVQEGGETAYAAALTAFEAERDTARRYALLGALGSTRDTVLAARARDYGLGKAVQIGEMRYLYSSQMDEPENRQASWNWLTRNFDAYRQRLSPFAQSGLPKSFSTGACSNEDAERVSAFIAPRVDSLIGGDRGLAQTLESIRQCAALRKHIDHSAFAEWVAARGSN
jgi:alanyl aminopeptidase